MDKEIKAVENQEPENTQKELTEGELDHVAGGVERTTEGVKKTMSTQV